MTVLCVESTVVYADGVAAIAAEGGANKTFEVTGTNSFATSALAGTYAAGIVIRATAGEETIDDGDIAVGAKMSGVFTSTVTGTDIRNLRTERLALSNATSSILRRLIVDGTTADAIQFDDTIDAEDIIIHNCDDGWLASVVMNNSLINKCTVVGAGRFGYAQGKFNNCVDVNSANQGYFNEAAGSTGTWENDGTGTNSITESPATDIFVDFAGGKYGVLDTSSAGAALAGAFIYTAGGGGTTITPTGIASTEAFGSPTVINLNQVLGVTGITSLEAFGLATIVGSQILQPSSISSLEALGAPVVISGAIILEPSSISSQEALGTPSLVYAQIVSVTGIDSEEAFGIAIVQDGIALVIPVNNRDTYQAIQEYLRSTNKFVSTQNNEIIMEWLRSEGITEGAFNNMFNDYWESSGFTGAYNDRWKKWKGS